MGGSEYTWAPARLSPLKGSRIFLTGGTGFFGKWLLRYFVETFEQLGTEVVVLSRNPDRFKMTFAAFACAPNISFIQGDVRSFDFPDSEFDYVVHAATPVGSGTVSYDSEEMYSIIVEGTERVLEFSIQAGAKRLLYVSSGAVYGIQPQEISHLEETAACVPVNAYGRGKMHSEKMCREASVDVVIARCFSFIGEYLPLDNRFAIGNFILDCIRRQPIEINGDGTPMRSYMHGSDLVNWLMTLLVNGESAGIYNVGSDFDISIAEAAKLVRHVVGCDNKILVRQKSEVGALPSRYVPSIQKALRELDLNIQIDLEAAIRNTVIDWKMREYGN